MQQDLIKISENLTLAKQETKPVEITEININRAQSALQDKQIKNCTEDELKAKLTLIYSIVGLRHHHWPAGQEKADLHTYIFFKYGNKTLSEFVLAFDLAINDELDLKKEDVKVYDQFTINYLASVMTAYKKWLYKQHQELIKKPVMKELEYKEPTDDAEMEAWLTGVKRDYLAGKYPFDLLPISLYDYLAKKGDLGDKKEFWQKAKEERLRRLKSYLQEAKTEFERNGIRYNIQYIESGNKSTSHPEYSYLVTLSKRLIIIEQFKK